MTMDGQQGEGVNTIPSETKSLFMNYPILHVTLFTLNIIKSKVSLCCLVVIITPSICVPVFPAALCYRKERGQVAWAGPGSVPISPLSTSQNYNHSFGSTHYIYTHCHDPASNVQRLEAIFSLRKEHVIFFHFVFLFDLLIYLTKPKIKCQVSYVVFV